MTMPGVCRVTMRAASRVASCSATSALRARRQSSIRSAIASPCLLLAWHTGGHHFSTVHVAAWPEQVFPDMTIQSVHDFSCISAEVELHARDVACCCGELQA